MPRALLSLLLPASLLFGQNAPSPPKDRGPKSDPWQGEILTRLHRMRVDRLQQSLGIPEGRAKAIADRWAQFDQDGRNYRLRMKQLQKQVSGILFSPLTEDEKNARIRPLMEQYSSLRQQHDDLRRKFEDEVRDPLTPAQQGRLLLLMEEIQHAMFEAIKNQRPGAAGQ